MCYESLRSFQRSRFLYIFSLNVFGGPTSFGETWRDPQQWQMRRKTLTHLQLYNVAQYICAKLQNLTFENGVKCCAFVRQNFLRNVGSANDLILVRKLSFWASCGVNMKIPASASQVWPRNFVGTLSGLCGDSSFAKQ